MFPPPKPANPPNAGNPPPESLPAATAGEASLDEEKDEKIEDEHDESEGRHEDSL